MAGIGFPYLNDNGFDGVEVITDAVIEGEPKYIIDINAAVPNPPSSTLYAIDDFLYWFLAGLNKAQKTYNENHPRKFNAYRDPVYSTPVLASNGSWYSTVTFTIALKVKVDKPDGAAMV
ncbi:MAG TPA: hypothetical protein V6C65_35595 [Allocoleopsis sp.]